MRRESDGGREKSDDANRINPITLQSSRGPPLFGPAQLRRKAPLRSIVASHRHAHHAHTSRPVERRRWDGRAPSHERQRHDGRVIGTPHDFPIISHPAPLVQGEVRREPLVREAVLERHRVVRVMRPMWVGGGSVAPPRPARLALRGVPRRRPRRRAQPPKHQPAQGNVSAWYTFGNCLSSFAVSAAAALPRANQRESQGMIN